MTATVMTVWGLECEEAALQLVRKIALHGNSPLGPPKTITIPIVIFMVFIFTNGFGARQTRFIEL